MAARLVGDLASARASAATRWARLPGWEQPDRFRVQKPKERGPAAKAGLFSIASDIRPVGIKGYGHLANARNLRTTRFLSVGQTLNGLKFGGKWFT